MNDLDPSKYKGWLNPKIEDEEEFNEIVREICNIYRNAPELEKDGIHVISCDEKTGIQANEHKHKKKLMRPNEVEKIEQEYIRHGTTTLIASRNIATGEIIKPILGKTRTEIDFVNHIESVVTTDPNAKYIFIMDQLNTHKSESLVKFIAKDCGISEAALGEKGKHGILKSMETRKEFLSYESHRIRIVYTPKHCSWLNQIEIWFSILGRSLLNKRSSFKSVEHLKIKIANFIEYYNKFLAKPFKWTYKGKVLSI